MNKEFLVNPTPVVAVKGKRGFLKKPSSEKQNHIISFALSDLLNAALREVIQSQGISISIYIRKALIEKLERDGDWTEEQLKAIEELVK